jgi:hypothetical protein
MVRPCQQIIGMGPAVVPLTLDKLRREPDETRAGGSRSTVDIFKAASDSEYSDSQVRRAKRRIGAIATRERFATEGQWSWTLGARATK